MDAYSIVEAEVVVETPPKPRVWTVFLTFFGTILLLIPATVVFLAVLAMVMHGPERLAANFVAVAATDVGILGSTLCTMVVLAGVAILAAWASPAAFVDRLRLRRPSIPPFGMAIAICGTLSISLAFDGLSQLNMLPESSVLNEIAQVIGGMTGFSLIGAVLTIGIAPGIAEELLFRGYIQTRLTQRWGPGVGIFITAALFGLLHIDPVHGAFAVVMGLFLGYLTERSGSIRPAIISHAVNNIVATLAASPEEAANEAYSPVMLLVSAGLILAFSAVYLRMFVPVRGGAISSA